MEDIHGAIESKKAVLTEMLSTVAFDFIPPFVVSDDFHSYFDTHRAQMKSHAKRLHVDSKAFPSSSSPFLLPPHTFPSSTFIPIRLG